jgi:hypothetical protein
MMLFRQSLAYAVGEDQLAIRKMAQDLKRAPLSWSRRFLDARRTERNGKLFKMPGGGGHHFERVATA